MTTSYISNGRSRAMARRGDVANQFVPPTVYPTIAEGEQLLRYVDKGGALTQTPGDSIVRTYLSLYGALGLVRAYEVTGNPAYLNAAWGFAAWYRDHMDGTTGYVDDWSVTYDGSGNPTYTDTGNKDSTDAYAGMYLTLLWSLHVANPTASLTAFSASIPLALHAIESTQQIDGLTYALPTYDVKYLEDNVEALYGARCAQSLAYVLASGNTADTLYVRAKTDADNLARGVGIMWDWETQVWDYAIHSSGYFARNDWTDDNARRQQMWATGWGEVVSPLAGAQVLAAYVAAFPTWASQSADSHYEIMATWAYRRAGDIGTATSQAGVIETNGIANSRNYPWTCQDSGLMVIGQYGFTQGMSGTGADGNPIPNVVFPNGTNLIFNSGFADSNSDGLPDGLSNYGGPANSTLPLISGQNAYQMVVADHDVNNMQYAPFDLTGQGGTWYCFSIYKMTTSMDESNSAVVLTWEAHDSSDNLITYSYNQYANVDVDNEFHRIWISFLVPTTGTPYAKVHLSVGLQNGGSVILASPKFEHAGAAPTPPSGGVPRLTTPATITATIPFLDTFARSNNGALVSPWVALAGSSPAPTWSVLGNAARVSADGISTMGVNLASNDQQVTAKVVSLPATDCLLGLLARATDTSNNYELDLIHDTVNGTFLSLQGSHAGTGLGPLWTEAYPGAGLSTTAAGDTITLQVQGTTLKVKRNGTVLTTLTNSAVTTGPYAGMNADNYNAATFADSQVGMFDNFSVTVPS